MSERTETISVIIPAPDGMSGAQLRKALVNRTAEAWPLHLSGCGLVAVDEPQFSWRPITQDEAAARFPEGNRAEMFPYLANAWLATAEVRVTEAEAVAAS